MPNKETAEKKITNRLTKKIHIVSTSMRIDFKKNNVEIFILETIKTRTQKKESGEEKQSAMIKEERNTKVYNLLSKKFRVSQDYKTIFID